MPRTADTAARLVLSGIVALAVAMGIGRFAFTPLLPLMMRDGILDAAGGADWAAANYAGYLAGALSAARLGRGAARNLQLALAGVAAATLLAAAGPGPWTGLLLRFAAGVFSAWVLVLASSWCLGELARAGAGHRGAWIYTGVGTGIALAGTLAWIGGGQPARMLWLELGLLAAAGAALVSRAMRASAMPLPAAVAAPAQRGMHGTRRHLGLVGCYAAFGFGYILPATFLPALARARIDDPRVFGLTWPVFGLASAASVALVARAARAVPRRRLWAAAQGVMALGTALPAISLDLPSLTLSAVLVGGTFMLATMAGLQHARELEPADPTPLLARMTSAFAAGQIAGPVAVRLLSLRAPRDYAGITQTSAVAALLLAATAAWLWYAPGGRPRGAA